MKKKIKIHLIILLVLIVLVGGFLLFNSLIFRAPKNYINKEQINTTDTITVEQQKQDISYLVDTLKSVHPSLIGGFTEEQKRIINEVNNSVISKMQAKEFYFLANKIVTSIDDAHTMMYLDENSEILDTEFYWLEDGLYIAKDGDNRKKGDKVVAIKDYNEEQLLDKLSHIISAENKYWIQERGKTELTKKSVLEHLGLVNDDNTVTLKIYRDNQAKNIDLAFVSDIKAKDNQTKKWINWYTDKDMGIGVFKLDICRNNDEYKKEVKSFFNDVYENNINNVVIDVSDNTGGDSSVIDEFLSYIDIKEFASYSGLVRFSPEAKQQRGRFLSFGYVENKSHTIKNIIKTNQPFDGDLYVLTSNKTFSSANWVAVVIQDNNIGTVIGEPTGNAPDIYGDVLSFRLPNSGFYFQVSYNKWKRPSREADYIDSLYPDIVVNTTIDDLINKNNPQIEAIIRQTS
jgi:C-terminal processing protease CtpA/Prc